MTDGYKHNNEKGTRGDAGYSDERRIPMSARVDLRSLAPIAKWLYDKGYTMKSRSDAIHTCIETLYEILQNSGHITPVATVDRAYAILRSIGIDMGESYTKKKLNRILSNESYSLEGVGRMDRKLNKILSGIYALENFYKDQGIEESDRDMLIKKKCNEVEIDYSIYRDKYPKKNEFHFESSGREERVIDKDNYKPTTKQDIIAKDAKDSHLDSTNDMSQEELEEKARKREKEERDMLDKMKNPNS